MYSRLIIIVIDYSLMLNNEYNNYFITHTGRQLPLLMSRNIPLELMNRRKLSKKT